MVKRPGWSIVELVVVIATLAMLAAIMLPSLSAAMDRARLTACKAMLHDMHQGAVAYCSASHNQMPPFAFSDSANGTLPMSGQWGGTYQPGDPAGFLRQGMQYVNLWSLVQDGYLNPQRLFCPSAPREVRNGSAGIFPYTYRSSTYCLRFPYSQQLFFRSGPLANWGTGQKLLGIYDQASGGQNIRVSSVYYCVPQVRLDMVYAQSMPQKIGDGDYDATEDTMLSDGFWMQNYSASFPSGPGLNAQPARSAWCHASRFNVVSGAGAVKTVTDDGTVAANSVPPGGSLADDGMNMATYAEKVWQFFDGK